MILLSKQYFIDQCCWLYWSWALIKSKLFMNSCCFLFHYNQRETRIIWHLTNLNPFQSFSILLKFEFKPICLKQFISIKLQISKVYYVMGKINSLISCKNPDGKNERQNSCHKITKIQYLNGNILCILMFTNCENISD